VLNVATTNYIWDELNDSVLMEADESGATTGVYSQEPERFGGLISQCRNSVTSYFHQDILGSTRLLTDQSGTGTDTFTYDAFGNEIARTGMTETPFQWVGEKGYIFDAETGTYYVRARTFQPSMAQWISADPLGLVAGVNLLIYVGNQPTFYIDPSGLHCQCCCCVDDADIVGLTRYEDFAGAMGDLPRWGHKFTHVSNLSYIDGPQSDCTLQWFECSTSLPEIAIGSKIDPGKWNDMHDLFKDKSSASKEWRKYEQHMEPYGTAIANCERIDISAPDPPAILRISSRALRIVIRVSSAPNCPCKNKNITLRFEQILIANDQGTIAGEKIGLSERMGEKWEAKVYSGDFPESNLLNCGTLPE